MDTSTKQSDDRLTIYEPQRKQSDNSGWLIEQVTILAEAFGEPITPARLRIYAERLADLHEPALTIAFRRACLELRFFPKIAELRELAGSGRAESDDAAVRAAWDEVTQFVRKYVGSDPWGNYGPEHGWHRSFPTLPVRLLDSIRRSGGWGVFACMTNEDFPFVQKRFFEEFKAWRAVELISNQSQMLDWKNRPTLSEIATEPANRERSVETVFPRKRVGERLTESQVRKRRSALQRQAQDLRKRVS